jgi:hypothetical protein
VSELVGTASAFRHVGDPADGVVDRAGRRTGRCRSSPLRNRTLPRERDRGGGTDAAAGAGHDRDLLSRFTLPCPAAERGELLLELRFGK